MNGKQAKLLRKMAREDKKSKRLFNIMDHNTKGSLRKSFNDYIAYTEAVEAASADVSEQIVDGGAE